MRQRALSVIALALSLLWAQNCQADLIVDFEQNFSMLSGTSGANSTSSFDVFVRHSSTSVEIGEFSLRFGISAPVSGTGVLRFLDPQSDSERIELDYVLAGKTLGSLSTTFQNSQTELIQSDNLSGSFSFPNAGQTVTIGTTRKLLATLELEHLSPSAVDGVFEIFLLEDTNSTYFQRYDAGSFVPTLVPIDGASYTNTGTVAVSAVPEPSTFCLLSAVGMMAFRRRRRRANKR